MAAIFGLRHTPISYSILIVVFLDPDNVGTFGISSLSCIDTEKMRFFMSTSGWWWPYLIYDLRWRGTVFTLVPLCFSTTKCGFGHWDYVATLCRSWDWTYSYLLTVYGRHLDFRYEYSHQCCTSLKSYPGALPSSENRIEKFLPVPKIMGGASEAPLLGTKSQKNARAAQG